MHVLVLTKIFPNRIEPHACPFNRQQFAALAHYAEVDVLATIPWFPAARSFSRWSRAGRLGSVPALERIDQLSVFHPRYAYFPKLGGSAGGPLYVASVAPLVWQFRGSVDVIVGSWAYPDGYAAVVLARWLGVPAVIKVHGSDVHLLGQRSGSKKGVEWALEHADGVVAVSHELASCVEKLGAAPSRVHVVPNGVDVDLFHPRERSETRRSLGVGAAQAALFVGRIEQEKGVLDLVRAFARRELQRDELWFVGDGPERQRCVALARELGVHARFFGERPLAEVAAFMAASDVVVLPSYAEGSPNVVAEALACGRRVVASDVGGVPELVHSPELGWRVAPGDVTALGSALEAALGRPEDDDAEAIRRAAGISSWSQSAGELFDVLSRIVGEFRGRAAA
ncbi:MAG: glycosyltransferase family 4 protein [Polyangiaceae bacterium]